MKSVASSTTAVTDWITERDRVRALRMQRHLVIAALAASLLVFLSPFADTVPELALVPVLIWVVVRSIARGADAGFGHMWGWVYEEPEAATGLDRLVGRLIERSRPPPRALDTVEVRVRPLDPFSE